MEGPGDYSSLDRPRILASGGRSSDNLATSGFTEVSGGGVGRHTPSVNEISGRASTPTTLTTLAAQYHSRYLPSAVPGSNFALMNSFLTTGGPSAETRKSLVPDLQHYWSVHAESFPRYLMTRGLYPPYPPLFSAGPESLSILGPGVACVPGSAGNAGPSSSMSGSHYQRFIEMQNEAFLATVTASASHHHQALYGLGPNSIQPSFLEQSSTSSHASTPLSLVKQEPKEISCSEKAAKQSERRSSSFKLDLDHAVTPGRSRDGHFLSTPHQDVGSGGGAAGGGYREQKAVVTSLCSISSNKPIDKRSAGHGVNANTANGGSNNGNDTSNDGHVKKATGSSSSSSESGSRRYQAQVTRKSSSPAPNKDFVTRTGNPHAHAIPAKKPSPKSSSNLKHPRAPTSTSSSPFHSKELSGSSSPDPSVIISIPTSISAPIPLASVQHDGVLLAALASPSSAAASSAAATVKSVPSAKGAEKSAFSSVGRTAGQEESPKTWPDTDNPGHGVNRSFPPGNIVEDIRKDSECTGELRTVLSAGNSRNSFGDENSDVVVDSTDDTESVTIRVASNSEHEHDRAIAETIERVATATSENDDEDDGEDDEEYDDEVIEGDSCSVGYKARGNIQSLSQTVSTSLSDDSKSSSFSSPRQESTASISRTTMAKTQPVSMATTSSGCVILSSNSLNVTTTTQAAVSALRYYNTFYSKPQGSKRVHAQTYVPEVGVFKGPSAKAMMRNQPPTCSLLSPPLSSSLSSSLPASQLSRMTPDRTSSLEHPPLNVHVGGSLASGKTDGFTPSPGLLSPPLLSPGSVMSCTQRWSSSTSPRALAATPDVASSLDSASADSASVASVQSVAEDNEEDSDSHSDADLVIDGADEDEEKCVSFPEKSTSAPSPLVVDEGLTDLCDIEGAKSVIVNISASPNTVNTTLEQTTPKRSPQCVSKERLYSKQKEEAIDYSLPKVELCKSICLQESDLTPYSQHLFKLHSDRISSVRKSKSTLPSPQRCVQNAVSSNYRDAANSNLPVNKTTFSSSSLPSTVASSISLSSLSSQSSQQDISVTINRAPRIFTMKSNQEGVSRQSSAMSRPRWYRLMSSPRSGSAPPPDTEASLLKKTPSPEQTQSNRIEGVSENSSGHTLVQHSKILPNEVSLDNGSHGNIPVGIAVAQIRPQHIHHYEGDSSPSASTTDMRLPQNDESEGLTCLVPSVNTSQSSVSGENASPSLSATHAESDVRNNETDPAPPLTGRLPPTGHVVNPSLWLQQLSFPIQAVNTAGAAYNPIRYPISAPSGFKFAHDSLTGQFFLIATGDTTRASYQSKLATSSLPVEEHRRRDRQSSRPDMGQNLPPLQPMNEKVLNTRMISTLRKDGSKQHAMAQPFATSNVNNSNSNNNSSSTKTHLLPTASSSSSTSSSSSSLTPHQHLLNAVNLAYHPVKSEKRPTQSRGCSPIIFDSNGKFLPSQSLSANFKLPQTCSVAVQTCDFPLDISTMGESSEGAQLSSIHPKRTQVSSDSETTHSVPTLNPLSVHCPDIDPIPENVKARSERLGYNPFTDPQILQAADGLELLSTLAEKRPKCSSYDDPKRIFPSPSDSFKSDTASVLAPEDTLSPGDGEVKSGQCTPRRDVRRDLSPKWSLPKKEPSTSSSFGDFKTPTGLELMDAVEVRERLAEVQRRYKEKQKELAKLDSKKPDDAKTSKRGPGRPPKKKALVTRKSDDDSSSSSSKAKDSHHQHKKKRPAEELVDRVFRKLPPVKPAKVSRSIHYVKSKTGPFFKRKPASSSSKRNKDLFGLDDKSWSGLHEGKHKKKYREEKKSKSKKKDNSSKATDSSLWKKEKNTDVSESKVALESSKALENTERRGRPPKAQGTKNGKESVKSVTIVTVKSEPSVIQSDTSLGRLNKLSFTSQQSSVAPVTLSQSPLTANTTSNSTTTAISSSTIIVSNTTTTITSSSAAVSNSVSSLFTSSSSNVTFGSMTSILEGTELSLAINSSSSSSTILSSTTTSSSSSNNNISNKPLITSPSTSLITSHSSMPSLFSFEDSSILNNDNAGQGHKRKGEDDSDTDTSDTSPNKKRKPGRPRKINPDKSAGGTETIWAKKSSSMSLLQIPDSGTNVKESDNKLKMELNPSVMKPLFLDEEWCRRRSERIFLSEPSPQPSPSPRAEPVWKLSNFMPKNTKITLENPKENKDDMDQNGTDGPSKDQEKLSDVSSQNQGKKSPGDSQATQEQSSSPDQPTSSKGKKGVRGKGKATEKDQPKPVSRDETSTPSPTPSMKKARRAQENTKMKHQKAKSLHDLTQKVKKKYSKGQTKKAADEKKPNGKKGKKRKSSSDSSDTDNAPLSFLKDRPTTPEPRSAVIELEDLKDGLKVLYLNDGLFYEGIVKAIQPPDVYGVLTAGQRGNRPHILCQEEILRDAVVDVKPGSIRYLSEGARICAFWSQQFSCLYPGTIAKTSPNPHLHTSVNVEFDDGDSGRIPVDHVRLLPSDFPIIEYEPDPLENLPKRRKRTSNSKTSGTDSKSSKKSKTVSSEEEEEKEKSDDDSEDSDSDDSDDGQMWKWAGKSTKRPGLKGRAKKEFYKSIVRGKESIMVGDSAVFVSTGRVNCPYIGRVESLWESWGGQKMVRVSWYYHPEETKGGKRLADTKNALFESAHGDENDVQTISHKCEVLSHAAYKRRLNEASRKGQSIGPNIFYLAGYYDPTVSLVKFEPGVL